MKKTIIILIFFVCIVPFTVIADNHGQVTFIVKSSSESLFQTALTVESKSLYQSIMNAQPLDGVSEIPLSHQYILFDDAGMVRVFILDDRGRLYDMESKKVYVLEHNVQKQIKGYFTHMISQHFGDLVYWEEVQDVISRYSSFDITDLETGIRFRAERRAGSNHADVQPLSYEDTEKMKQIFDGKWSWNRRAILVNTDEGEVLAASMHGMPHGAGALANGFPGHFCIHFNGSTTHTTRKTDLSHQLMAHKAAGKLLDFVSHLTAEDVVKLFFFAVNQKDMDVFTLIYGENALNYKDTIDNIEFVRVQSLQTALVNDLLVHEVPITFIIKEKNVGEKSITYLFKLVRDSPQSRWRLTNTPFDE